MDNTALILASLDNGLEGFPEWFLEMVEKDIDRMAQTMSFTSTPTLFVTWYHTPKGTIPVTTIMTAEEMLLGREILRYFKEQWGSQANEKIELCIRIAVLIWETEAIGAAIPLNDIRQALGRVNPSLN